MKNTTNQDNTQADTRKVYGLKEAGIRKQEQQSSFSVLTIFPE